MGRYNASRGYHKALSRWLPSFDVVKVRAAPAFLAQLRRRITHRNIAVSRPLSHACKSDIPVSFIWLPMARCIGCACALRYTERCCAASMLFHRIGRWWLATCHPGFREGSISAPSINTYESRAGRIISVVNALCFVQSFNLQSFCSGRCRIFLRSLCRANCSTSFFARSQFTFVHHEKFNSNSAEYAVSGCTRRRSTRTVLRQ
jgi:hypothetical protein